MTGRAAVGDAARAELYGPEQAAQSVPEATKTPGVCQEYETHIRAPQIASQGQRTPSPPPRDPVKPGRCAALADPGDPHTLCGRPARPYICGWRCDRHRPRARRETL